MMITHSSSRQRTPKQQFTCLTCGKVFERWASTMHNPDKPYCSKACHRVAQHNGSTFYCALCDTPVYRRPSESGAARYFCSRECYMEWRALHRNANTYIKQGQRHLHRVVAEQYLGRPLLPDEVVHHLDLNKHNNDPSNLAVLPNQEFHARVHFGEVSDAELRRFSLV